MYRNAGAVGGSGGVNGNGAMGSNSGGLAVGSGPDGGSGKATDSGGSAGVIYNARAKESLLVAGWVFEPESEAVGMRGAAFEGPLVSFACKINECDNAGGTPYPPPPSFVESLCRSCGISLNRVSLRAQCFAGGGRQPFEWHAREFVCFSHERNKRNDDHFLRILD